MSIISPLASLVETIRQVAASAQREGAALRKNEAATRSVLIDPVLRALGWDIGNTFMVEVEKTHEDTRVDYALYDRNREIKAVVEAKPLGANLADAQTATKLLVYAFSHGVQDVFLTDGMNWHHYADYRPGKTEPKRRISLAEEPLVEHAAYLVQQLDAARFWNEEEDDDTIKTRLAQLESTVTSLRSEVDTLKRGIVVADPPPPPQTGPESAGLIALDAATNLTGKRPRLLRLPTGALIEVRTWKDVLVESCKTVIASTPALPVPLLDAAGKKVALLDKSPPPKGLSHVSANYGNGSVYIYTNYDANHCVMNALHILQHLPKEKRLAEAAVAYA